MPHFKVHYITTTPEHQGRRLDNFLLTRIKGVPRSHIYAIIRSGEVRVNSKRIPPSYRLSPADEIRVPPIRKSAPASLNPSEQVSNLIHNAIIYQDDQVILLNKPAKIPVHGGAKQKYGVIEVLRQTDPQLHLVHRLDRASTGCLLIARGVETTRRLQSLWHNSTKIYRLLVRGHWKQQKQLVENQIKKIHKSGEHIMTTTHKQGKYAATLFSVLGYGEGFSFLEARLITGRTHQIRCHCSQLGHPIIGDDKYDTEAKSKQDLALHAYQLILPTEAAVNRTHFTAPYPAIFTKYSVVHHV